MEFNSSVLSPARKLLPLLQSAAAHCRKKMRASAAATYLNAFIKMYGAGCRSRQRFALSSEAAFTGYRLSTHDLQAFPGASVLVKSV